MNDKRHPTNNHDTSTSSIQMRPLGFYVLVVRYVKCATHNIQLSRRELTTSSGSIEYHSGIVSDLLCRHNAYIMYIVYLHSNGWPSFVHNFHFSKWHWRRKLIFASPLNPNGSFERDRKCSHHVMVFDLIIHTNHTHTHTQLSSDTPMNDRIKCKTIRPMTDDLYINSTSNGR